MGEEAEAVDGQIIAARDSWLDRMNNINTLRRVVAIHERLRVGLLDSKKAWPSCPGV